MSDVYSVAGLDDRVIQVSEDNIITYANSAFCGSLNLSREDVIGSPLERFDHFDFGDGVLQDLVEQEREQTEPVDHESSYVEPESGETQHVRLSAHSNAEGVQVLIEDRSEQYQMEQAFQRYVGPQMLEQIKDAVPDVFDIPERRPVTALFSDLRNFTNISRDLKPDQVRKVLNLHFDTMIPIINDYQGMIDKLMGDGIMALFGAPLRMDDHTIRAVNCALEMMRTQRQLMEEWSTEEIEMPPCGIGLQVGEAIVGDVGSSKQRDFTAVGPPINLAARLCGAAKPDQILTTEQVIEQIREQAGKTDYPLDLEENGQGADPDSDEAYGGKTGSIESSPKKGRQLIGSQFSFLHLDQIKVKGFEDPVQLISVQEGEEFDAAEAVEGDFESQGASEEDSDESIRVFDEYELLEKLGRGGMGVVYRARHQHLGRIVALKMLLGGEEADEQQVARFEQETKASAMLSHPHIVSIHEFGKAEGYPYFTMDYIDGQTLSDFIDKHGGVEARSGRQSLFSSWIGTVPGTISSITFTGRTREYLSVFKSNVASGVSQVSRRWSQRTWSGILADLARAPYWGSKWLVTESAKRLATLRQTIQSYESPGAMLEDLAQQTWTPIDALARRLDRYTPDDWNTFTRGMARSVKSRVASFWNRLSRMVEGTWCQLMSGETAGGLVDSYDGLKQFLRDTWADKRWYEPIIEAPGRLYGATASALTHADNWLRGTTRTEPPLSPVTEADVSTTDVPIFEGTPLPALERSGPVEDKAARGTLKSIAESRLSIEERVRICSKVLDALGYAHDQGLVHRDVKPGNIMIDDQGEPVLMDFGLAHVAEDDFESLTQSGALIGTTAYMSPEQARGETDEVDERTDVYAMGAVLYEMLAGRPAFEPSGNQFKDLERIAKEEPPDLQDVNPRVPDELGLIVNKAMNKEKSRRYASPLAFKEDLRRFLDNEPITARPPSLVYSMKKSIMRHPGVSATAAASLVLLLGVVAFSFVRINQQKNEALQQRQKAMENMRLAKYQSHLLQGNNYFAKKQWPNAFKQFALADERKKGWQSQLRLGQIVNKSWPVLVRARVEAPVVDGTVLPNQGTGRVLLVTEEGTMLLLDDSGDVLERRSFEVVPDQLEVTPDKRFIVAGFPGSSLYVLRRRNLETVAAENLPGRTKDLTFGANNQLSVLTTAGPDYTANNFELPLLENHRNRTIPGPGDQPQLSYTTRGNVSVTGTDKTVTWNGETDEVTDKVANCHDCIKESRTYFGGQRRVEVTWKPKARDRDPVIEITRDPSSPIYTPRKRWYGNEHRLTGSEISRVQALNFTRRNDESWLVTLEGRNGIELWEIDRNAKRLLHSNIDSLLPHRESTPRPLDSTADFPSVLLSSDTSVYMLAVQTGEHNKTFRSLPGRYAHHATSGTSLFALNENELVERRFGDNLIRQYSFPNSLAEALGGDVRAVESLPGKRHLLIVLDDRYLVIDPSKSSERSTKNRVPLPVKNYELGNDAVLAEEKFGVPNTQGAELRKTHLAADGSELYLVDGKGRLTVSHPGQPAEPDRFKLVPDTFAGGTIKSFDRNDQYTGVVVETNNRDRLIVRRNKDIASGDMSPVFFKQFKNITRVRLTDGDRPRIFVGLEKSGTEIWDIEEESKLSNIPAIDRPGDIAWEGELLFGRSVEPDLNYSVYSISRDKYLLRSPWPSARGAGTGIFSNDARTVGIRTARGTIYYLRLRSAPEARDTFDQPTGIPGTGAFEYQINKRHVNINESSEEGLSPLKDYQFNAQKNILEARDDLGGFVDVDELNKAFFVSVDNTRNMRSEVTVGPKLITGKFYSELTFEF